MGNEETNNKHFSNDDTAIASMKQSHTSDPNFPYTKHKRKGSDSNRISQEATTQYFNNLGHSQLHPQPQCPIQNKKDETTTSNNDEPNKQMTKVIMSSQLNSNSVMNDTIMNSDNNNIIGRSKQCCYSPINCARKLDFSNVVEYTSVSGNNNNNGDERNSSSTNIKITNNNITTTTTTTTTANTKNVVVPISKSINKIKLKCNCSSCKRIFSIVNGETTLS